MNYKKAAILLLSAVFLSGCQKTPQEPIVRQKGEEAMDSYREAKPEEEEGQTREAGESKNEEARGNPLADRLGAPKRYQTEKADEEGYFTLSADAEVFVPLAEQAGVYPVEIREMNTEEMERIHRAFFGDAPVYDGDRYFTVTKAEALTRLDELKGYQAEGNLDPFGYIADFRESGGDPSIPDEEIYNLQQAIDSWQEIYEEAPEEAEKVEIPLELGMNKTGEDAEFYRDRFVGAVETEEGGYAVEYRKDSAADKYYAWIGRNEEGNKRADMRSWLEGVYDRYPGEIADAENLFPKQEEAEEMAGISREEAIALGNAYVEKLGDPGLALASCQLSLHTQTQDLREDRPVSYDDGGYLLFYTRTVNGFPTTYEQNLGGGLESMDSTNDVSGYERVCLAVNKEGLQMAEISNWCRVGEARVENVEMKPFSEIAQIFEQMMEIQSADSREYLQSVDYQIKEVRLGYLRIYDPGESVRGGVLVPVWDFFGLAVNEPAEEGEGMESYTYGSPSQSLMTINAVDGTVVNRSLGY